MDPLLTWIICGLSALLLVAGGFVLARARAARQIVVAYGKARELKAVALKQNEELRQLANENRELQHALDEARRAGDTDPRAPRRGSDPLGETTELPIPQPFFERNTAPRMQKVSEDEFELAAAEPGAPPAALDEDDMLSPLQDRESTRRFQIHSAEAVVFYLQRIDELTEENRTLKTQLESLEGECKTLRSETGDQAQRRSHLVGTAEKLKQELARRQGRIRQLEAQVSSAPRPAGVGLPRSTPGEFGPASETVEMVVEPSDEEVNQQVTLQVPRLEEAELRAGRIRPKGSPPRTPPLPR